MQFFKQSEYDAKGNAIAGGSVAEGKTVYHGNGKWHVDMPLPPPGGKQDPNAIYYDYKPNGNIATSGEGHVVMFDLPTQGTASQGATRIDVEFKTYLVDGNGPLWEIAWTSTTIVGANGLGHTAISQINGGPANKFAPALDTKQWNIGNRITPVPKGSQISTTTERAVNPYFKN
ncbi:MAG TPA: hypothetical protein VHV55_08655 [Pirellulales bacterium]|nr:hypothetical protein [Pirellulales bacterium]